MEQRLTYLMNLGDVLARLPPDLIGEIAFSGTDEIEIRVTRALEAAEARHLADAVELARNELRDSIRRVYG
jgi:hypothetical protein